jgi:hypothetical protein
VFRTKTNGVGPDLATFESHRNEFTGDFPTTYTCGDWVKLGDASSGGRLTCNPTANPGCTYGSSRSGGNVGWISRAKSDNSTLWASTTTGRLFVSKNADADPATAVTFTRIDTLDANSPNRAISSISIDPGNPNRAYVSYLSYNELVTTNLADVHSGHVFRVDYDPVAGTATWTNLEGTGTPIGNQPVNSVAFDPGSGDLYAATDFGVHRLAGASGANPWTVAAPGLPVVTVAGLTINPGARQLLAATHGRGAYQLTLP